MRKVLLGLTLAVTAVMFGVAVLPATADPVANNWYVCKYVNKPGPREVIQTGQNPIFVDENAIMAQTGLPDVHIGDQFADAQILSVVVAGPEAPPGQQPGPGIDICGVTTTTSVPPPVTTTTSVPPPPETTTTTTAQPPPQTTTTTTSSAPPPPTSTTTQAPPPVTSTTVVPPVTTTAVVPPPVTTTVPVPPPPTTTTITTTAPPTHTAPPPGPPEGPGPPNPPNPENPPKPPPLAFTGTEQVLPIGVAALALLLVGIALLRRGQLLVTRSEDER